MSSSAGGGGAKERGGRKFGIGSHKKKKSGRNEKEEGWNILSSIKAQAEFSINTFSASPFLKR